MEAFGPLPAGDLAIPNANKRDASCLKVFPAYGVHLEGLKALMASSGTLTPASTSLMAEAEARGQPDDSEPCSKQSQRRSPKKVAGHYSSAYAQDVGKAWDLVLKYPEGSLFDRRFRELVEHLGDQEAGAFREAVGAKVTCSL